MSQLKLEEILAKQKLAELKVETLGKFLVYRLDNSISNKEWGRDKTIQLFQYLVTSRHRQGQHKEQIVDRIWEEVGTEEGARDFKVAMHGINKAIEPDRKKRTDPKFIIRQGLSYRLDFDKIWIDVEAFDALIEIANENLNEQPSLSIQAFRAALKLYQGVYLPNRVYEDWASMERERLQVLVLGAYINLGELILDENPMEAIRLSQQALIIDATWEDAYRLQMEAYFKKGNRPNALRAYKRCVKILDQEYGIEPLPETKRVLQLIKTA